MASNRMETRLIIELIRAKMINAKREKETHAAAELIERGKDSPYHIEPLSAEWRGQEMMAKQLLSILEQ